MRRRRYIAAPWLLILRPVLRFSLSRDAFVLRGVGNSLGPVLRPERRRRRQQPASGQHRSRAGRRSTDVSLV